MDCVHCIGITLYIIFIDLLIFIAFIFPKRKMKRHEKTFLYSRIIHKGSLKVISKFRILNWILLRIIGVNDGYA